MSAAYDPEHVTYFAEANFRNQQTRFGIKSRDRTRHMYVVGKSGVGKSTLLENMAIQDIQNGHGVAVLDPHGSFAEKMLDYIPEHRIKDVVYFAPFDLEYPVSFNMLEDVGADKRHFVASGLMSTFKKIWVDAWSARMEYILNNILLALLEYPDATLLGVNRMLSDKDFRKRVVANISDPSVKAFWTDEFEKYGERYMQEAGAAIQNKIGQFTANPLVRNIIGQPKSSFDVRDIMDNKKILIVNLSKGRIGEQNTSLLGSMIITKIYIAAMSRADVSFARMNDLPPFYFYVDEFQSFANESFANILSEARKYKLALIIAHQYIAQMEESVRDAVFGNVGTSLSFRVGPLDAELLEKVYSPQFLATDLINLGMAQVYLSLMINDIGSPPFSAKTLPPIPRPTLSYRDDVIEWTRAHFALNKDTVEENIRAWFALGSTPAVSRDSLKDGEKKYTPPASSQSAVAPKPYVPTRASVPSGSTYVPPANIETPREPYKKEFVPRAPRPALAPVRTREIPAVVAIEEKEHQPFKKALESVVEKVVGKESVGTDNRSAATDHPMHATPSPALAALLDSLDSTAPAPRAPAVTPRPTAPTRAPFAGEKPLREVITPVKLAERGATDASKNLLREALMKATAVAPSATIQMNVETTKETTTTTMTSTPTPHISTPPSSDMRSAAQPPTPAVHTGEIAHHELLKVLE